MYVVFNLASPSLAIATLAKLLLIQLAFQKEKRRSIFAGACIIL
jgi:hypothetical protein